MLSIKNLIFTLPTNFLTEEAYASYLNLISNVYSKMRKSPGVKISSSIRNIDGEKRKIWFVTQSQNTYFFQSSFRASRFMKGFERASQRQWERYGLQNLVNFSKPNTFIDIGANIGEVSYFSASQGFEKVVSIEPDSIPRHCLTLNVDDKCVIMDALVGERNEEINFYISTKDADSSIIPPTQYSEIVTRRVITLDFLIGSLGDQGEFGIKIDAEGAEPEVLKGLDIYKDRVLWLAIDVGPERLGQSTRKEVTSLLKEKGFTVSEPAKHMIHAIRD
jgi:FkbM family methyltransferase